MNPTTRQTRLESYVKRPVTRQVSILNVLKEHKRGLTARQLAEEMGFQDLNYVKPRLTELMQAGVIETDGKTLDMTTNRNVAVWKIREVEDEY